MKKVIKPKVKKPIVEVEPILPAMYADIKKPPRVRKVKPKKLVITGDPIVNIHYVGGCFVELLNFPDEKYNVQFINADTGQNYYTDTIGTNAWTKCYFSFYVNWLVKISVKGELLKEIPMELKDRRVFIVFDSSALGDTLAWFPYVDEFRKTYGTKTIVSTYKNSLFAAQYPELEFVEPGGGAEGIMAQYNIGWYYKEDGAVDFHRHPVDPKTQPLQQTASDILGLPFTEIKPKLAIPKGRKTKMVSIGVHSTMQAKYWNAPNGWQEVVDYLKAEKYKVVNVSNEADGHNGNKNPIGATQFPAGDLQTVMAQLVKSKFYVGVGSGLTWLAWACNVPVILISGFSLPFTEMQAGPNVIRITTPEGKRLTTGLFNRYNFEKNWDWYQPKQFMGTDRQYECSKSITSEVVITAIKTWL